MDELGEGRNHWPRDSEASADIFEEGHFELHAGFGETEHGVSGVATFVADGSSGDFSLCDEGADIAFRGVGMERNVGPLKDAQQVILVAVKAFEQAVERRIAGSAAVKDAIESGTQNLGLSGTWGELVFFEGAIEPPDHPLGDFDGVALLVVGGDQFMDEPFSVNPAQSVHADAELAGVVGNDDRVR